MEVWESLKDYKAIHLVCGYGHLKLKNNLWLGRDQSSQSETFALVAIGTGQLVLKNQLWLLMEQHN